MDVILIQKYSKRPLALILAVVCLAAFIMHAAAIIVTDSVDDNSHAICPQFRLHIACLIYSLLIEKAYDADSASFSFRVCSRAPPLA